MLSYVAPKERTRATKRNVREAVAWATWWAWLAWWWCLAMVMGVGGSGGGAWWCLWLLVMVGVWLMGGGMSCVDCCVVWW